MLHQNNQPLATATTIFMENGLVHSGKLSETNIVQNALQFLK